MLGFIQSPMSLTLPTNLTVPHRTKRALGMKIARIGLAIGMLAPWEEFAYHEATLCNVIPWKNCPTILLQP